MKSRFVSRFFRLKSLHLSRMNERADEVTTCNRRSTPLNNSKGKRTCSLQSLQTGKDWLCRNPVLVRHSTRETANAGAAPHARVSRPSDPPRLRGAGFPCVMVHRVNGRFGDQVETPRQTVAPLPTPPPKDRQHGPPPTALSVQDRCALCAIGHSPMQLHVHWRTPDAESEQSPSRSQAICRWSGERVEARPAQSRAACCPASQAGPCPRLGRSGKLGPRASRHTRAPTPVDAQPRPSRTSSVAQAARWWPLK